MSDTLIWLLSILAIVLGCALVLAMYALHTATEVDARLDALEARLSAQRQAEEDARKAQRRQEIEDRAHLAGHPPRVIL